MFKKIILLLVSAGLLFSGAVYAEGVKIAVVNVAKAMEESPQAVAANKRLEIEFAPRKNKLIQLRNKQRSYEDRLAKQGIQMTEAQLRKLERNIRDLKREIRRASEDYREEFNIRRNNELQKLQKRVKRAIIAVATKNKFDVVVGEGVLYSSGRVDITADVLKVLENEFTSAPQAKPNAPVVNK